MLILAALDYATHTTYLLIQIRMPRKSNYQKFHKLLQLFFVNHTRRRFAYVSKTTKTHKRFLLAVDVTLGNADVTIALEK